MPCKSGVFLSSVFARSQKGKEAALAVSGVRTKKHAKKMDHRRRMAERDALEAAAQQQATEAAPAEVQMKKPRVKKAKKAKAQAPEAMQE